ncbi:hypothetical protein CHLRE_07g326400v5 [Chlamydomonas reinhardtii]|uniref:Protein YIP n=1 Tax=Chlamydomonas reinhardtii TaxID=3055 RepID=A0A2K3DJJ7_CHLRE|nr:uncharacterized protein CHLRE_07g326400v5 [Chlamydomonas reinhardtii]PNW80702.1 hypothetical protein CHLRE_07g326400v5 [Chlamydomonas reinhardtii]
MWPFRGGNANNGAQAAAPGPELFQDVPQVPGTSQYVPQSPPPTLASSTATAAPPAIPDEYTLDESIWKTIWRDIVTIGRNLRSVLIPVNWKFHGQAQALRNWDLWGPLVFMLVLAIVLSLGEANASAVFAMVFAEVALGAIVLTINVILLGGELVFFQAVCLLGYCLFPLVVAAIICASIANKWIRCLVTLGCLAWASVATIPFIGNAVPRGRKMLAVYPVMLMYVSLAWLAMVKT